MVTGEDPEAAGVLRHRFGDAELGGEVRDDAVHRGCVIGHGVLLEPARQLDVGVERRLGRRQTLQERRGRC